MSGEILFFLLFILIIIVLSVVWTTNLGAPWFPTSMTKVHRMLRLAGVGSNDVVYDLGCGDGRILITAARHYGARAVGIEIDPLRYLWCQALITALGLRHQIKIIYGNFFEKDLNDATVITCYLLQETNDRLVKKLKKELRPGTKIVSHTFRFSEFPLIYWDRDTRFYQISSDQDRN